jgi:hypothetical protein
MKKSKLVRLIESEMDRAGVVLAAKAITDKLTDIAEDLAKIGASDLIPLADTMRTAFGPDLTTRFEKTVTEQISALNDALRQAKDVLGGQITNFENIVEGKPGNDMDTEGAAPGMSNDMSAPDDMGDGSDEIGDVDDDVSAHLDAEHGDGEEQIPAPDQHRGEKPDDGIDLEHDLFKDDGGNAAGRERKMESLDTRVLADFRQFLREGKTATLAARMTSAVHDIELNDVVSIVKTVKNR